MWSGDMHMPGTESVAGRNLTRYCACHAQWRERPRQHRTSRSAANVENATCTHTQKSVPNIAAPAMKHDITPHAHAAPAAKIAFSRRTMPARKICFVSMLDAALPMQFAKTMQHHTSKVLCLPRKMNVQPGAPATTRRATSMSPSATPATLSPACFLG